MAVRVAIGASRMALIRQFAAESSLLAAAGAIVAIFLARSLGSLLLYAMSSGGSGPDLALSTDWRVLVFATFVASATCVIFGIAPAVRAVRIEAIVGHEIRRQGRDRGP